MEREGPDRAFVHLCEKLGEEVLERPVEPHREEGVDEVVGPGKTLERGLQLDGIEDLERFDAVEAQDGLEGVEVAAKGGWPGTDRARARSVRA